VTPIIQLAETTLSCNIGSSHCGIRNIREDGVKPALCFDHKQTHVKFCMHLKI
jgi:hypothetical protein